MTPSLSNVLADILGDLSKHMPSGQRFKRLMDAWLTLVPSDACAILQLEGLNLTPRAAQGFGSDMMGRQFVRALRSGLRLARPLRRPYSHCRWPPARTRLHGRIFVHRRETLGRDYPGCVNPRQLR